MAKITTKPKKAAYKPFADCGVCPPEMPCPPKPCEPKCEEKCPPRCRMKDAIRLTATEVERCFTVTERMCGGNQYMMYEHCVTAEVRRRGKCKVLTTEIAYKSTMDGKFCIAWSEEFLALPCGQYEMDLVVDAACCTTICLQKPDCRVRVTSDEPIADDSCKNPPDCAPPLDYQVEQPKGGCGEDCGTECN